MLPGWPPGAPTYLELMRIRSMRNYFLPLAAALMVACSAETSSPAVVDHWEVIQGGAQLGTLGLPLDSLVRVRLVDEMEIGRAHV